MAKDYPDPDAAYHPGIGMAFNPYAGKVVPSAPPSQSDKPPQPSPTGS